MERLEAHGWYWKRHSNLVSWLPFLSAQNQTHSDHRLQGSSFLEVACPSMGVGA
jgi:hypothetical protein